MGADFNPSRVLAGDPLYVCEVGKFPIAAELVWQEVIQRSDATDDWRVARVQQVDITRDFLVTEPVRVIEALNHIPRARVKQHLLHHDPTTTRPTGLVVATSREGQVGGGRQGQKVTLFDKSREMGRTDVKIVRWEARCKAWGREIGQITYGYDLTDAAADRLAQNRWEWSAMGTVMASELTLVDAVLALKLSAAETEALIGHAVLRATGQAVPLAKGTQARRRARMEQLDLVLSEENSYRWGSRLDFTLGREVAVSPPPAVVGRTPA